MSDNAESGLRARIEELADMYAREADAICPEGQYDKADKAWRVAHVRRRIAGDLRTIVAETSVTPPEVPACTCTRGDTAEFPAQHATLCPRFTRPRVIPPASGREGDQ
jgi:hypothetical protein